MFSLTRKDCLEGMGSMQSDSIDCIVTSPPYNKKGVAGGKKTGNQIWQKHNIDYDDYADDMPESEYQDLMVRTLNEMHRVLRSNGSIFFNHKPRRANNRCVLPTDFIQRSDLTIYQVIIWNRKNSPNIRNDIFVPNTEYIYWLTKGKPRTFRKNVDPRFLGEVWDIAPERQSVHPAPFPIQIPLNCINMTTAEGDTVLDPYAGTGTTMVAADMLGRNAIGFEISEKYCQVAKDRLQSSKTLI